MHLWLPVFVPGRLYNIDPCLLGSLMVVQVAPGCTSDVPPEASLAFGVCSLVAYSDSCLLETLAVVQVVPRCISDIPLGAPLAASLFPGRLYNIDPCLPETLAVVQVAPGCTSDVPLGAPLAARICSQVGYTTQTHAWDPDNSKSCSRVHLRCTTWSIFGC